MRALGVTTKREAVEESLRRSVRAARQLKALREMTGAGWEGDLDDMRTSKYVPADE
jgi:Arc/MetJ family transcription regulator